eukprot:198153_1
MITIASHKCVQNDQKYNFFIFENFSTSSVSRFKTKTMCKNCSYKSARLVKVHNKVLVSIYYGLLFLILCYICLYTIWYDKGYQANDLPLATTSAGIYGTGWLGQQNWQNTTIYDAVDLVNPATEENAIFITLGFKIENNQTRGICNGNAKLPKCTTDGDCIENLPNWASQGIQTGICGTNNRCQVNGWCPLQSQDDNYTVVNNVGNFTMFVRVNIRFPIFGVYRSNLYDIYHNGSLVYGYNLFTVNQILNLADKNVTDYKQIATSGMVVIANSVWNCNLDHGEHKCNPTWNFKRIDENNGKTVSSGYHFRSADYNEMGTARRLKYFRGLRVIFVVDGIAGKFSFAALLITIGSGIAYLSVASIMCDIILQYFLPESKKYNLVKEAIVKKEDEIYFSYKRDPVSLHSIND